MFFCGNVKVKVIFWREMHHIFQLKNNRLNNHDQNDQNNRDYDFFHNGAAQVRITGILRWVANI